MLASKLLFILDDLLWVLTDSQLKAIIHYAKSLSEAMEKSAQQRKSMTAESLQVLLPLCSARPPLSRVSWFFMLPVCHGVLSSIFLVS